MNWLLARDSILANESSIINGVASNNKIGGVKKYFGGKNQNQKTAKTKILIKFENYDFSSKSTEHHLEAFRSSFLTTKTRLVLVK